MSRDHFAQTVEDAAQTLRQGFGFVGPDAAAADIAELIAGPGQQAEAGHPQAGVDAEYANRLAQASVTAVPLTATISMPLDSPSTS